MEKERTIKSAITVFTEIWRKQVNPSFKFSQGGATIKVLGTFHDRFEKEFGAVTTDRLVDFCVCTARVYSSVKDWSIKQAFGPSSIKRLKDSKQGTRYYEDKWLSEVGLTREKLVNMIVDRSAHPLEPYIYMPAEESTKLRLLNQEVGFVVCQTSTLGWSPLSKACGECIFTKKCKKVTAEKYPELYRIREQHGKSENR